MGYRLRGRHTATQAGPSSDPDRIVLGFGTIAAPGRAAGCRAVSGLRPSCALDAYRSRDSPILDGGGVEIKVWRPPETVSDGPRRSACRPLWTVRSRRWTGFSGPACGAFGVMPDSDARLLRSFPDVRCECPNLPNPREANRVRTPDATGQGCSRCGLPLPSTELPRTYGWPAAIGWPRRSCRTDTSFATRDARCAASGWPTRGDGDRARYLHVDDSECRVTAVD